MRKTRKNNEPLSLPALRGRIGDWYYYVTLLKFEEIANRVLLPEEIDEYEPEELQLGEWIQREIDEKRTRSIVHYLKEQKQRFFNSLILGLYGGKPYWQDLNITINEPYDTLDKKTLDYFGRTFGVLTLNVLRAKLIPH